MKAAVLVRKGNAAKAFEIREVDKPKVKAGEVLIKVEGFGLNFADVLACQGVYPDAPPMPSIIGYDVVGTVEECAPEVSGVKPGDRVAAFTHFGGYAEYAISNALSVVKINGNAPLGEATALIVQYGTAMYCAAEVMTLREGDKVLIHSAAGGVGTALLQYAKHMGCEIFATAGSESKIKMLLESGAHHAINYQAEDFEAIVKTKTNGKGIDAAFDAVGGKNLKKSFRLLAQGGKLVSYGVAELSGRNVFSQLSYLLSFGFYHPLQLLTTSKSLIGVNMLRIAENKPQLMKYWGDRVVELYGQEVFKPIVGGVFPVSKLAEAHELLSSRKSVGKITVTW